MTREQLCILFLVNIGNILALYWILFFLIPKYRLDRFRQEMFEWRDSLFDEAAKGHIDFDSSAYGMLRQTINGFIRFAHKLPSGLVIASLRLAPSDDPPRSFRTEWLSRLEELPPEQRIIFERYYYKMIVILTKHLLFTWIAFGWLHRLRHPIRRDGDTGRVFWNRIERVQSQAFALGHAK